MTRRRTGNKYLRLKVERIEKGLDKKYGYTIRHAHEFERFKEIFRRVNNRLLSESRGSRNRTVKCCIVAEHLLQDDKFHDFLRCILESEFLKSDYLISALLIDESTERLSKMNRLNHLELLETVLLLLMKRLERSFSLIIFTNTSGHTYNWNDYLKIFDMLDRISDEILARAQKRKSTN